MSDFQHLQMEVNSSAGIVQVSIPEAISEDNTTFYVIKVRVDPYTWTVKRRYREFDHLHQELIECGIDRDSLPVKKIIGNKEPGFVMKRRTDLETYMASITVFLERSMPDSVVEFLHLTKYDIHPLLQRLASTYYEELNSELSEERHWGPLELFAISTRLKTPLPPHDPSQRSTDFVNVADCACQLRRLFIIGSSEPLGTSDIIPNSLQWDLLAFKSLVQLVLQNVCVSPEVITSLGRCRATLKTLKINNCGLRTVAQALLIDSSNAALSSDVDLIKLAPLESDEQGSTKWVWNSLEELDLRHNPIERLDASLALVPHLQTLLMGHNKVSLVENLTQLGSLSTLELSNNMFSGDVTLKGNLPVNISSLDFSDNSITWLTGICQYRDLTSINMAANRITDIDKVLTLSQLSKIRWLNLQGNMVTAQVDYRLKVFEAFGKRCSEVCLDNETPSQPEVDKVSVLMALRVAKEGKEPTALFGNLPRRVN